VLDAVEEGLARASIALPRLLLEEFVDFAQAVVSGD
jgi:hypothetical protein